MKTSKELNEFLSSRAVTRKGSIVLIQSLIILTLYSS